MVGTMLDDNDPELLRVFAQAREPLTDAGFMAAVLMKIDRARRTRLRRQALVIAAVVALGVLNWRLLWTLTAAAVSFVGDFSPSYTAWLVTPGGWAVSMLIGVVVVLRSRPSRR
jgi:hypothetical protein